MSVIHMSSMVHRHGACNNAGRSSRTHNPHYVTCGACQRTDEFANAEFLWPDGDPLSDDDLLYLELMVTRELRQRGLR